jgi:hypothetical protein
MHNGIPICELFSDPRPFAWGDPHMHMVIPICKITHMGIQDLISPMRTTSLCIWGMTEKFPYAYRDAHIPVSRMYTGISVHPIPVCRMWIKINPGMHSGITS